MRLWDMPTLIWSLATLMFKCKVSPDAEGNADVWPATRFLMLDIFSVFWGVFFELCW